MDKQFEVGEWFGHGGVRRGKYGWEGLIVIPFASKGAAERCIEGLGNGEQIVDRFDKVIDEKKEGA